MNLEIDLSFDLAILKSTYLYGILLDFHITSVGQLLSTEAQLLTPWYYSSQQKKR